MRLIQPTALFALLIALLVPLAAQAEDVTKKRTVTVTGMGIVSARPDTASINIGVQSQAKTAREALDANTKNMNAVIKKLKQSGIADKDLQTTNFNVSPRHRHFKDGRPPVIVGYQVTNTLRITVRNLAKLGTILDETLSAGSNRMNGISLFIDKATELEDQARQRAIKDATRKANLYVTTLDQKLGQVLTISETRISRPFPRHRAMAMEARASAPVPIEAGEQKISANITVTFEIAN